MHGSNAAEGKVQGLYKVSGSKDEPAIVKVTFP